ncbi:hypothetical protein [Synechococcus elongatus]|uniref:Uncharacterized protein n=1 Tax=Synechococcus elongatus PCC 11802 TaxID=2283154 RepID=A0AAT9JYB9_SYNEL|nr:hypothetical protein [Synechococcus elongatus]
MSQGDRLQCTIAGVGTAPQFDTELAKGQEQKVKVIAVSLF